MNTRISRTRNFRRGQSVRDNETQLVGRIQKVTRRVLLVTFPNAYEFLSLEVAYPKATAHQHLTHYDPNAATNEALATQVAVEMYSPREAG